MNSFEINQFLSSIRHPSRYIGKELNSIEKDANTLFSGLLCGAGYYEKPDFYYKHGLDKAQRERIEKSGSK